MCAKHINIDFTVRPSTVYEVAKRKGLPLYGRGDRHALKTALRHLPPSDLRKFLGNFMNTRSVIAGDLNCLERASLEMCEDLYKDGHPYVVINFWPFKWLVEGSFDVYVDDVIERVKRGLERGQKMYGITAHLNLLSIDDVQADGSVAEACVIFQFRSPLDTGLCGGEDNEDDIYAKDWASIHSESFELIETSDSEVSFEILHSDDKLLEDEDFYQSQANGSVAEASVIFQFRSPLDTGLCGGEDNEVDIYAAEKLMVAEDWASLHSESFELIETSDSEVSFEILHSDDKLSEDEDFYQSQANGSVAEASVIFQLHSPLVTELCGGEDEEDDVVVLEPAAVYASEKLVVAKDWTSLHSEVMAEGLVTARNDMALLDLNRMNGGVLENDKYFELIETSDTDCSFEIIQSDVKVPEDEDFYQFQYAQADDSLTKGGDLFELRYPLVTKLCGGEDDEDDVMVLQTIPPLASSGMVAQATIVDRADFSSPDGLESTVTSATLYSQSDQTWFFTDSGKGNPSRREDLENLKDAFGKENGEDGKMQRNDDSEDEDIQRRTQGHLIHTNCSSSHDRLALCCKMAKEFDYFIRSHKQWWCHFDDDNYVNVVALGKMLLRFDSSFPWYLGKTSTASPLQIIDIQGREGWKICRSWEQILVS